MTINSGRRYTSTIWGWRQRIFSVGLTPALIISALLVAVVAGGLLTNAATVQAADAWISLHCDENPTVREEGQDFTLHARGRDDTGGWYAVWWYTNAGTAGTDDFVNQYALRDSARQRRTIVHAVQTRDDNYSEFVESFTVTIGNKDNNNSDTTCALHITDDDGVGIHNLEVESTPEHDGGYRVGEEIELKASFTDNVYVEGNVHMSMRVGDGGSDSSNYRAATYKSGSGTKTLTFSYAVKPGDWDDNGIRVTNGGDNSGFGGSGSIRDANDNRVNRHYKGLGTQEGQLVDGLTVAAKEVRISSSPRNGFAYQEDESILLELEFNQPVNVEGDLGLSLRLGEGEGNWRAARYLLGSGTNVLVFSYTVQADDLDTNGLRVGSGGPNSSYSGGRLLSPHDNAAIRPWYEGIPDQWDHLVGMSTLEGEFGTSYVSDFYTHDGTVYALSAGGYQTAHAFDSDGNRVEDLDIDIIWPRGYEEYQGGSLWGRGDTLWVSESSRGRGLIAYSLADSIYGDRLEHQDVVFEQREDGSRWNGRGLWSDGATVWILENGDASVTLQAFSLQTGEIKEDLSFTIEISEDDIGDSDEFWFDDFWMDSETIWLPHSDGTIYAYDRETLELEEGKSIRDMPPYYREISAIWVDDEEVWAFGGLSFDIDQPDQENKGWRAFSFTRPDFILTGPGSLVSENVSISSMPENRISYRPREEVEITLEFNQPVEVPAGSDLSVTLRIGEGSDEETARQAAYSEGSGTDTLIFTYTVQEGDADLDGISLDAGGIDDDGNVTGYRGDGVYYPGGSEQLYPSYGAVPGSVKQASGVRVVDAESANNIPWGIYVGESYFWLGDGDGSNIYAHQISDGSRVSERDIDVSPVGDDVSGLWSDGTTMWVLPWTGTTLYGFSLADGTRDTDNDISLGASYGSNASLFYDGTMIWIAQLGDPLRLIAVDIENGEVNEDKTLYLEPPNGDIRSTGHIGYQEGTVLGFFLNQETLWLSYINDRYYAHSLSDASYKRDLNLHNLPGKDWFNSVHLVDDEMWVITNGWEEGEVLVFPLVGPLAALAAPDDDGA